MRIAQVTYTIDIREARTSREHSAVSSTELRVRLLNHAIKAIDYRGALLTLELHDGRRVVGFISDDGASLVRTGVLA